MTPKLAPMRIGGWLLVAWLAVGISTSARAQAVLSFTNLGSTNFLDSSNRLLGWQFTVLTSVNVTDIGWFDWGQDGLSLSKQVGIWDTADQSLVVSVTVPSGTGATLSDYFRYVALGSPVGLVAGRTYRIAGYDVGSGGDPHVWDAFLGSYPGVQVAGFAVDSRLSLASGNAIGQNAAGFSYPTALIGDARLVEMGPNLIVAAIPEPSVVSLLVVGFALLIGTRLAVGRRDKSPRASRAWLS
jgi:hypothetical protein